MRTLFTNFPIAEEFSLSTDDTYHVMRVLRASVGDMLYVTDSRGAEFTCEIIRVDGDRALLRPIEQTKEAPEKERILSWRRRSLKTTNLNGPYRRPRNWA